jgi:hypothetical protein
MSMFGPNALDGLVSENVHRGFEQLHEVGHHLGYVATRVTNSISETIGLPDREVYHIDHRLPQDQPPEIVASLAE